MACVSSNDEVVFLSRVKLLKDVDLNPEDVMVSFSVCLCGSAPKCVCMCGSCKKEH